MNISKHNLHINDFYKNNSLIVSEIDKNIKTFNWETIFNDLPPGSAIVGGYLRDLLLDRLSQKPDIDLIVTGNSYLIGNNLADKLNGKFVVLDKDRNIVRIIFKQFMIDIAPQIGESLLEDLGQRDFTINSIAFSLDSRNIIDPFDGIGDLRKSVIRTSNIQNIINDPLRIIRCFRFLSELNFSIDNIILDFIKLNKQKLSNVAVERIQNELKKIIKGNQAFKAVRLINQIKLFECFQYDEKFLYEVIASVNCKYFNKDEIEKFMPIFYLTELLSESAMKKLKFSKNEILKTNLLRYWKNKFRTKPIYEFNEIEIFDLHKDLEEILPAFIFYLPSEIHYEWLKRWRNIKDNLFHPKDLIKGNTLKELIDLEEGPLLGSLLNYLSRELAHGRLDNYDDAIYKARQWFQQNAPKCD